MLNVYSWRIGNRAYSGRNMLRFINALYIILEKIAYKYFKSDLFIVCKYSCVMHKKYLIKIIDYTFQLIVIIGFKRKR